MEATMSIAAVLGSKGATVETITADARVTDAVSRLGEKRIGALPVVEEGRIVGIMSERDVIYCLRDHGPEVLEWAVSRVMTAPAITAAPDTPVLSALALMTQRRIRHLPVVEGGQIRGIVSIGDLVKYRMERIEAEADAMRTYIQSA
jgi:CBS domain-containing protein